MGQASLAGKLAKITPIFTPGAITLAVGVSAAVGIVFGIAPAIKAARKRPIQALKAE
jgi:putative ABC transport system permease protein